MFTDNEQEARMWYVEFVWWNIWGRIKNDLIYFGAFDSISTNQKVDKRLRARNSSCEM